MTQPTRGRRQRRQRTERAAPAYVTRRIPYFEFLSEGGLVAIEAQADRLLAEIGIEFRDDPMALDIWRKAGADVKGSRVRLEPGHARALCATAPSSFTQVARNPERSVRIGGDAQVLS